MIDDIRRSFIIRFLYTFLIVINPVTAAEECGFDSAGQICHAWAEATNANLPFVRQKTFETCWAASVVNLLRYVGVPFNDEDQVIQETTGVPKLGSASEVSQALNQTYIYGSGRTVSLSVERSTDNYTSTSHSLDNLGIHNALKENRPVYYGDLNHAMVVTDVWSRPTPFGLQVIRMRAIDPAIGSVRDLSPNEMIGTYAAIVNFTFGHRNAGGNHVSTRNTCLEKRIEKCVTACTDQYGRSQQECEQITCRPGVGENMDWVADCSEDN
ncbi:papain-like cysteine protease family protein [Cupriavidus malaysiensis]|uniref:papain-like cysteine protease family protein n=1 Tax=Cupriavidus malaysiensis TaxID=367825 RepID=UPI0012FFC774|nr:papain-like cysteine protease family protein [Cupriavidus malaysiensis]